MCMAFILSPLSRLGPAKRCSSAQSRARRWRCSLGRVVVVDAHTNVGIDVARVLRDRGADVCATTPCGNGVPVEPERIATLNEIADVRSVHAADAGSAFRGASCVISCYAASSGMNALVRAAEDANVSRFVLLSELGAGDSETDVPSQVYFTMRNSLVDKSLAERKLRESSLEWVIVRHGPLVESAPSGQAVLTEGRKCYGTVAVREVAEALVRLAESDSVVRRTLAVVDRAGVLHTSPYVRPLEFWEPLPFEEFEL